MKFLICGGRDFEDRPFFDRVMHNVTNYWGMPKLVIHGMARGADTLADRWALDNGILVRGFPADWNRHGRAAGAIRNQQMLDEGRPDLVIAFPGGPGTADMVRRAQMVGVQVVDRRTVPNEALDLA